MKIIDSRHCLLLLTMPMLCRWQGDGARLLNQEGGLRGVRDPQLRARHQRQVLLLQVSCDWLAAGPRSPLIGGRAAASRCVTPPGALVSAPRWCWPAASSSSPWRSPPGRASHSASRWGRYSSKNIAQKYPSSNPKLPPRTSLLF